MTTLRNIHSTVSAKIALNTILFLFGLAVWMFYSTHDFLMSVDSTNISLVIVGILVVSYFFYMANHYAVGCLVVGLRMENLDKIEQHHILKNKMRLESRTSWLTYSSNLCAILGLIGTLIGFWKVIEGIDFSLITDINHVGEIVTNMLNGLGIAIFTTITGAIAAVTIQYLLISITRDLNEIEIELS